MSDMVFKIQTVKESYIHYFVEADTEADALEKLENDLDKFTGIVEDGPIEVILGVIPFAVVTKGREE